MENEKNQMEDEKEKELMESISKAAGGKKVDSYLIEKWKQYTSMRSQWVEEWFPFVKDYTFKTHFIPLSADASRAIVAFYNQEYNHRGNLTEEQRTLLKNLEASIEGILRPLRNQGQKGFVRLSSRSPKDAVLIPGAACERMKPKLIAALKKIPNDDKNEEYKTLMAVGTEALCIESGREAMDLLLNSERVFVDLNMALNFSVEFTGMSVVIREWTPIPYYMEFRGFVHKRNLNALSQYDSFAFYKELQSEEMKREISERVQKFFSSIKDSIGIETYVIDFAVLKDKVMVIELNSWGEGTGSACFSWKRDIQVLENGPFELRVVTEMPPAILYSGVISPEWMEIIQTCKEPEQPAEKTTASSSQSLCNLM